ncbi:unnamed protein product [Pseudo-nitzschia multistriata]|uniref:Uncharacterized protein n=1 Tax=Pseudo-nitzschia multistriata TaxID=183589 RepID=A0A448ZFP5_9STRA|nr:unnamed protein product [Pseudo-nitzschia multistriata]
MVSRTPRHSSQPRPTMPHKAASSDAWDRANAVLSANGGGHLQRRSQSTVRYQSNGRSAGLSGTRPGSTRHLQSQPRSNLRPRAISANRLRQDPTGTNSGHNNANNGGNNSGNHDDPSSVARQILDLRERRETNTRNKRPQMNRPPSAIPSHITALVPQKSGGTSPTAGGLGLKPVGSMLSQEEIQAEERLRQAETKIGGMLQDLEELKFFQEIEMETPGPSTPRTPGRNLKANGPPTSIRASSPARAGGRLPPPPPANKNTKGGGLETYKPLSPRSIARLDRNSLELECQTIVRKLQILEQERFSHQATIEMYEITLQEHDNDKTKIQRLETELKKVSTELRKQLYNIQKGKESLVKEYEEKLQTNLKKLHRTQEKADAYHADLNAARNSTQKLEIDVEKYRAMAAKEKEQVDTLLSNEETLQLQLTEARNLNATLVKKVEKKRSEVSGLKEDLSNSTKLMEESNRDLEDAHASQITLLEQQLNMSKDRYTRLEQECTERNASLVEKENELNEAKIQHSEYEHKINDMMVEMETLRRAENEAQTTRMDYENKIVDMSAEMEALRVEADARFEEGKKATRNQEKRTAQKLVAERAKASREYEHRLKAMQEQLRHQTDRHHKEIEETRIRNQKNLESMKEELREEIRMTEGDKVSRLEAELASLKRTSEEEKMSLSTRLQDAQQKSRDAAEDFQRQDQTRQQELDHLHSRLNSYFNEFTEKDNQISRLKERLEESKRTHDDMEEVQKDQAEELKKNATLLETEQTKLMETERKLKDEIATMQSAHSKLENEMVTDIEDLRDQVEKGRRKLKAAEEEVETTNLNLKQAQSELEKLRDDLKSERYRAEGFESESGKLKRALSDMSKLEDDVYDLKRSLSLAENDKKKAQDDYFEMKSAYESSRSKVLELEQKYSLSEEDFTSRLETKEKLLERLEKTVKNLEFDLDREHGESSNLRRSIKELKSGIERNESDLRILRADNEQLREENENTMKGISRDIGKKDDHLREAVQRYTRTIAELETKLEEETQTRVELEDRLASARDELEDKQQETQQIVQRHTKTAATLENKFGSAYKERDQVKNELEQAKKDLLKKEVELREALSKYRADITALKSVKQEHNEYRDLSQSTREELQRKEDQIIDMEQAIIDLRSNLELQSTENKDMKISLERKETELKQRKDQINELVTKYTDKIAVLEAKLDEHSAAMTSTGGKVETVQAQADRKDDKIRELLKSTAEMEAKLEAATRSKENARLKAESLSKELDEKESKLRSFEVERIELETKLHTQSRSKDEARSKMSELSSRLERKERELRQVSDRYKIYVMELESKLDQGTDTKHHLQLEIDQLRNNLDSASSVSSEALELRQKVNALEATVANSRESIESLEQKLEEASASRKEISTSLKKANSEKAEVIAALEGVINEVQNREDEIESLSELLQRRDEELQHAKIIATKALASAKDIQKRYKHKDANEHSGIMGRMDEVNEDIDRLRTENETQQRKIFSLERDLKDKKLECKRLKDQLRQFDGRQMRENVKDDISAVSTQSTEFTNFSNPPNSEMAVEGQLQLSSQMSMDSGSFSPSNRVQNTSSRSDDGFSGHADFASVEEHFSKDSFDSQVGDTEWQDFDDGNGSGFDSTASDQQSAVKAKVERDALRKYVRQRYSSRGQKSSY